MPFYKKNSNFLNYWYYITQHLGAAPIKEYEKLFFTCIHTSFSVQPAGQFPVGSGHILYITQYNFTTQMQYYYPYFCSMTYSRPRIFRFTCIQRFLV